MFLVFILIFTEKCEYCYGYMHVIQQEIQRVLHGLTFSMNSKQIARFQHTTLIGLTIHVIKY